MYSMTDKRIKHGMYGTRIYRIWAAMKRRCYNTNYKEYYLYGGRGIKVCQEWLFFPRFKKWAIENGYDENLTLDRIDNERGYEPSNCRWTSPKAQSNNRRSNKVIEYNGQFKTLKEWSEIIGINYKCLYKRYKNGWSTLEMFETKSGDKRVQTP
jgi:hypothetical protein